MENWIDTMMKTVGVEPKFGYLVKGISTRLQVDKNWLIWKFKDRKKKSVFKVAGVQKYYPDFTPAKQLEIIKLIGSFGYIAFGTDNNENIINVDLYSHSLQSIGCDFPQALAQLTAELMKVEALDKEKVKEILEK